MWEYCILQLWSEARAELGCPGLWWVVLLAGGGHKADTIALLLHLPGHKLCDVILLSMGLKYRAIWELALRAAYVCWRWKKHVFIRHKSWEVTRFIKLRGAPISEDTSALRLWWGTSQVTKHCMSRNAEACSREAQTSARWFLSGPATFTTLPLPFPHLIKPVTSFWLSITFWAMCHHHTIHLLPWIFFIIKAFAAQSQS